MTHAPRSRTAARRAFSFSAFAVAAVLCILPGCYQRVVSAKGFGADQYNVSEPYQESGKIDEWLFGTPNPARRGSNNHTRLPQN